MLDGLFVYNFPAGAELDVDARHFTLTTCQRTLCLSYEESINSSVPHQMMRSKEAYLFLLEIICGLQSRLLGENEIVSQFKQAYKGYIGTNKKDNNILLILEKLFKDAKVVRSNYLMGLSQKTYASLTRKHFIQKRRADSILILGSGQLAQDLINQYTKQAKVFITARNHLKLQKLQNIGQCEILPWDILDEASQHPFICNTIGFDGVLLDEDFFQNWVDQHEQRLFIDLGAPSSIKTDLKTDHGVLRLQDIFAEGAIHEEQKLKKIEQAQAAIIDLAERRDQHLRKKRNNYGEFIQKVL